MGQLSEPPQNLGTGVWTGLKIHSSSFSCIHQSAALRGVVRLQGTPAAPRRTHLLLRRWRAVGPREETAERRRSGGGLLGGPDYSLCACARSVRPFEGCVQDFDTCQLCEILSFSDLISGNTVASGVSRQALRSPDRQRRRPAGSSPSAVCSRSRTSNSRTAIVGNNNQSRAARSESGSRSRCKTQFAQMVWARRPTITVFTRPGFVVRAAAVAASDCI